MSDETKPPAQVLTPVGIQSEEKVHDLPKPPPQVLVPGGIASQERVHEQPLLPTGDGGRPSAAYIRLLQDLTILENALRRRQTNNLQRRASLLKRINGLRRRLNMQQLELKDFR